MTDGSPTGTAPFADAPGAAPLPDAPGAVPFPDTSEGPLLARLARLRDRVADLVELRAAGDPTAADPLRGLYLTDEAVHHHLLRMTQPPRHPGQEDHGAVEQEGQEVPAGVGQGGAAADGSGGQGALPATGGAGDRLHRLARRLGLTELDVSILLIAIAPDLDRGFEPLYGYLNDDVSRRRATVGLALDLCGLPSTHAGARDRFHRTAPLAAFGLVHVEDPERPFLSRSLHVPDRLAAHLLGDDTLDAALDGHIRPLSALVESHPEDGGTSAHRLAELLATGPLTVYLREHRQGDGLVYAATALRAVGYGALHYTPSRKNGAADGTDHGADRHDDTDRPHDHDRRHGPVTELLREARLLGCAIVVSELPERPGPLIRALSVADIPVVFTGQSPYDPQWSDNDPLVLDVPRVPSGAVDTWSTALGLDPGEDPGFDLAETVAPYRLGGDRIARAARSALGLAEFEGTALTAKHLRVAARQQSASGLERHARRIRPDVGWNDLVLPEGPLSHLRELALRARHRERVLGDWRLSAGGGRGRGVLAMFAGESGTGKTLSAEVVAADLGLDLYVVQLSSIVDKYVGETEKNLERIFTEADRTDSVLLFDEADAVFGKRSEVKDSHDRYANLESAYLLQRLEAFDGIALLTTNLRANIDDAFTRRLDLVVDFPFPDAGQRLALWQHSLAHVPCADDIDPGACARDFELAGGSIRSAVVTAAYTASGRGEPVTTEDLLAGARREYRKAGRLVPGGVGW
jgi:hypothetical protein